VFAHTPQYPDEPPVFKPRSLRGLADSDLAGLAAELSGVVQVRARGRLGWVGLGWVEVRVYVGGGLGRGWCGVVMVCVEGFGWTQQVW